MDHDPDPYRPRLLRVVRVLSRGLLRAMFSVRIEGSQHIPRTGPVLLAGNHVGSMDGPLVVMMSPRPVRALVKDDFFHGRKGFLLAAIGQIPVQRGLPDRGALRRALSVLAHDGALVLFPEGECGPGTLEEVNPGVAWLALRSQAPIVPIACFGTDVAIPFGEWRPRLRTPVRVVFGAPFRVPVPERPRSRGALAEATETIRLAMVDHLQASRTHR